MLGKGKPYKSFKEALTAKRVWVQHIIAGTTDTEQVLADVILTKNKGFYVRLPSGGVMEVMNPKAMSRVIGDL